MYLTLYNINSTDPEKQYYASYLVANTLVSTLGCRYRGAQS